MSRSFRAKSSGVKAHGEARAAKGLARHFEGWQPGLLAIFLAGTSAILAVPRAIDPSELPEPMIAPASLDRIAKGEAALAARAEIESAEKKPLDFDVRALGSAIRAYGIADIDGRDAIVVAARRDVVEAAKRARAQGEEPLLKLRAFQLRAFLRALSQWETRGGESDDLRELGGSFLRAASRNGWVRGRQLVMDEPARRALFKKRWNEITMTKGERFDLAIDEQRAMLRFLLRFPPRDDAETPGPKPRKLQEDERVAFAAGQYRMRKIDELAKIDPSYPADFARGVVLYRLRRFASATEMFRRHLDAHPEGPLTLRAQNHLRASLGHASDEEL